ncbi:MAG TPA: Grx4 family monothiol glutaredoxin [Gammaproteobacteria bacterium]|nr:Grx4 family monothiol glutaredoxin [Gammaproteobacteria bacterium]
MSNVLDKIKAQVTDNPIILYMKGSPQFPQCGFSMRASQALQACGASFAHVDVLQDAEIREGIKAFGNWPTIPQLYVNGELIGGCDIILEMYQSGELEQLLSTAKA